jgi:hypothetical protein
MNENVKLILSVADGCDLTKDAEAARVIQRVYVRHNVIVTACELWEARVIRGCEAPWELPDEPSLVDCAPLSNDPVDTRVRRVLREMTGEE